MSQLWHPVLLLLGILVLSFFFAKVEIHIEGGEGWAAKLPTWRIEQHWLLDLFWGGRAMTGYHAWVFPFIVLLFHFPFLLLGRWSVTLECRALGSLMLFWVGEDFLWFVLNPAYGLKKFSPAHISWHKHWLSVVPVDYAIFLTLGLGLIGFSFF